MGLNGVRMFLERSGIAPGASLGPVGYAGAMP
jgi:hypothetical protein